jgi:NhaP-type Na+/H+ or K+/H+ antiporter
MESLPLLVTTLAGLLAVGYPLRGLLRRVHVPPALSLIALGIVVGPAATNLLPERWLASRPVLSAAAFVVLLLRAGLAVSPRTLRAIAAPSLLLGLVPVAAELCIATVLCHEVLFDSWPTSLLAGFLVAAVSPAVVLPMMLAHKDAGRGASRAVPDLIMGQTIVNAVVAPAGILLMLGAIAPLPGAPSTWQRLAMLPVAIVAGVGVGAAAAWLLRLERIASLQREVSARLAALGFLLGALVVHFACRGVVWLDAVAATLAFGFVLRRRLGEAEHELRPELRRAWNVAEIVLFANLGSTISLRALGGAQLSAVLLVLVVAIVGRLLVAAVMTGATTLRPEERRYVAIAHLPKATIQAVFGPLPLLTFRAWRPDLVGDGETLVILAAVAIVVAAPIGAVLLERWGAQWLGAAPARNPAPMEFPPRVAPYPAPATAFAPPHVAEPTPVPDSLRRERQRQST